MEYTNKKVVVMGLGLFDGGVGVTRYLAAQGANVLVTDLRTPEQLAESLALLKDLKVDFRLGKHCEEDFLQADLVVVNPAVPDSSPFLQIIHKNKIAITTEINIFLDATKAHVIGITGSNGKSTTTALIESLLKAHGYKTWLGGNIGRSLLEELPNIQKEDRVVLELSSFQLERMQQISPSIAVVTNLTPNHLDRHGTMESYGAAKQNILKYQNENDLCVLNGNDPEVKTWHRLTKAQTRFFGTPESDIFVRQGTIILREENSEIAVMKTSDIPLPGRVNEENTMAAILVARGQNVPCSTIAAAVKTFVGLPHRLEFVGNLSGRRIYEDSIATTPESTMAALETVAPPIVLLAGGSNKGFSYDALGKVISQKVKILILMGETAPLIHKSLDPKNLPQVVFVENMEKAVECAHKLSLSGDAVLLSPASTSFGMFRNFVERGETFKKLIQEYFRESKKIL